MKIILNYSVIKIEMAYGKHQLWRSILFSSGVDCCFHNASLGGGAASEVPTLRCFCPMSVIHFSKHFCVMCNPCHFLINAVSFCFYIVTWCISVLSNF